MAASRTKPLFEHLLGADFESLPASVRRLHRRDGKATYHGEAQVRRGQRWLARLCGWATRLPPEGQDVIVVDIDAGPSHETWTRRFPGHVMASRLWAGRDLLCERLGLVTFGFRLSVHDAQLHWTVARVSVFGLRLPVRAFAGVRAVESERDGRYRFEVSAALPLAGPLVHYCGWLDVGA